MAEEIIGGYRLVNLIGSDPNTQLWEVAETSTQRRFAMKIPLPEKIADADIRRVLLHEANVAKQLVHPNIIKIIQISSDAKSPFSIMELFPAVNMKLRIIRKQYDYIKEHALKIAQQTATALMFMHAKGWLHRDVKPDNIPTNSAGEVRLMDFPLAQKLQKPSFFSRLFQRKGKTQGTRSYMSPEQIRGENLDGRADIYSFGATFYEIITYRPPFRASSNQELLNKHIGEKPVPPKTHNTELTNEISELIMHMLAKKREGRPRDFHQVVQMLKTIRFYKTDSAAKT